MTLLVLKSVFSLLPLVTVAQGLSFTLDPQAKLLNVVSDKFLSVALDCSNIEGRFSDFNLTDPYLTKLVGHLSPMYFRVGGTYADRIVFSEDGTKSEKAVGASDITFLASDWIKVYQFTQNANVRLIYDLNSLVRNEDGTWNSENAKKMVEFSSQRQMDVDWELGNEPDLYNSIYKTHVDATQLASDYQTLRNILDQYEIYKSSYLIGNDMFDVGGNQANRDYLSNFLRGAASAVHAVTWHHYYFAGKDATEDLFLNPNTFNYLEQRVNVVKGVVQNSGSGNKIWLGETSSAYNGGAANMSNRFIGTFLWLDKLGLGAKLGLDVIIRQTVFHDNYALLDNNYVPNPDWWVSVVYKKLVGTGVLNLSNDGSNTNKVRLYAHCGKADDSQNSPGIVVFGFNVDTQPATVSLGGFDSSSDAYAYELTYDNSLYSQSVKLNGDILSLTRDGELPQFKPQVVSNTGTFSIAPQSLVFWVFTGTNVDACKE